MRQRFDGDEVAGIDFDLRFELLAEVAPVHGLAGGGQVMVAALCRLVGGGGTRHLRRHQRDAAGTQRGDPAGGGECTLDEAATLLVEGQRLSEAMAFVFRARLVVTCAHGNLPRVALVDMATRGRYPGGQASNGPGRTVMIARDAHLLPARGRSGEHVLGTVETGLPRCCRSEWQRLIVL